MYNTEKIQRLIVSYKLFFVHESKYRDHIKKPLAM